MTIKNLKDIPFERMSAGQSSLALKSVYANKMAVIEQKKGNQGIARTWTKRATTFASHIPNLHSSGASPNVYSDNYTENILNKAKYQNSPILRQSQPLFQNGLASLSNNPSIFAPTAEQIQACSDEATRIYGTSSSRSKTQWYRSCISRLPYKNLIVNLIGEAGGVMLYTTIKNSNSNFNSIIKEKDIKQSEWVRSAAVATGLPELQVLDVLSISVMDQLGESPDKIEEGLRNFMLPLSDPNSTNIVAQTQTPNIFQTGGSALPKSNEQRIAELIINIAIIIVKLFKNVKAKNEQAKLEAAFTDINSIDDSILMKCWDMNGIAQDCSVEGDQIRRCYDRETGEEIDCNSANSGSSLAIIGGTIFVTWLAFLSIKKNKNRAERTEQKKQKLIINEKSI